MAIATAFRRYTTPTHRLTVEGISLVGYDVYVTYSQKKKNVNLTFSGDSVEVSEETVDGTTRTVILVYMEQTDTAKFVEDYPIEVQVNWFHNNLRNATAIKTINAGRNLLEEVIV